MPAGAFDMGRNFILDSLFGKTATPPANYYLALLTSAPRETDTADTIKEPIGGAYKRALIPNDTASWEAASNGLKRNRVAVKFATPTANWGTINYYAFTTALTGGIALLWGELSVARVIVTGTAASFEPGTLTIITQSAQSSLTE